MDLSELLNMISQKHDTSTMILNMEKIKAVKILHEIILFDHSPYLIANYKPIKILNMNYLNVMSTENININEKCAPSCYSMLLSVQTINSIDRLID